MAGRRGSRGRARWLVLGVLLAFGLPAVAEPLQAVTVAPGAVRSVQLPPGVRGWTGTFEVPANTRVLSVAIHSRDDLDLYLRRGRPFEGDFRNEADIVRPAPAPMESVRITGPMTPGRWYVAVVRRAATTTTSPFDVLVFLDQQADGHTLLPRQSERVSALRTPSGVTARTWFPEGADAVTFSFSDGKPPEKARFRLVGPVGAPARVWTGPLTLRRDTYPAGLYLLQWEPDTKAPLPDDMRLHVDLGSKVAISTTPSRASVVAAPLTFDHPLSVRLGGQGAQSWHFRVNAPRGLGGFVVEATAEGDSDVDLFLNRGQEAPKDEEKADYFSRTLDAAEQLVVAGNRTLRPGTFTGTVLLVESSKKAVSVRLRLKRLSERTRERTWGRATPSHLSANTWRRGSLEADESPMAWYYVTVPAGTRTLQAQIVQASAPVELVFVRRTDGSVMRRAMTARVDERLDVTFNRPPDTPRYFVLGVYARDPYDGRVDYRVAISMDTPLRPPQDLRWPPFLDTSKARPPERACAAVVELTVRGNTGGSGTCVTPTGRILTCRHVLQAEGEDEIQRRGILVAFTARLDHPPTQAFVAKVVQENDDWDLALLEITEDVFGRPVGRDVVFPWLPLGTSAGLRLGDRVAVLGFPTDGSDRSRTPIIYSPGVVSGLEAKDAALRWIKTDAWISSGHSGGAMIDPAGKLVGVPAATLGTLEDLGLAIPVSALPKAWLRVINRDVPR